MSNLSNIASQLECVAEEHREAAQYPDDERRYLEKADELDRLEAEVRALAGSALERRLDDAMARRWARRLPEWATEHLLKPMPATGAALIEQIIERIWRLCVDPEEKRLN
jgi:hypothetical protein